MFAADKTVTWNEANIENLHKTDANLWLQKGAVAMGNTICLVALPTSV